MTCCSRPVSLSRWIWKSERYHPRVEECTATEWEATSKKWENLKQILWVTSHPLLQLLIFTVKFCLCLLTFPPHASPHSAASAPPSGGCAKHKPCLSLFVTQDLKKRSQGELMMEFKGRWIHDSDISKQGGPLSLGSISYYLAFIWTWKPNFRPYKVCRLFNAIFTDGPKRFTCVLKLYNHVSPNDV